jgi:hypothetical protein
MAQKTSMRSKLRVVTKATAGRQKTRPRLVSAGDTLAKPGVRAAEADRVARRTSTKQTVQATVVSELLGSLKKNPASETLQQLQSVIGGRSGARH